MKVVIARVFSIQKTTGKFSPSLYDMQTYEGLKELGIEYNFVDENQEVNNVDADIIDIMEMGRSPAVKYLYMKKPIVCTVLENNPSAQLVPHGSMFIIKVKTPPENEYMNGLDITFANKYLSK